MKLTRKLIPAFIMLLVSAVLMSTASFAWFAMNTEVTATGMQVTAKAGDIFLEVKGPADGDTWKTIGTNNLNATLYPVDHEDFTTAADIETASKWFYYYVNDLNNATNGKGDKQVLGSTADYVAKTTYQVRLNSGMVTTAYDLFVSSITLPADTGITAIIKCGEKYKEFSASGTFTWSADTDNIADTMTGDVLNVDVYLYIDGENANVYTNNVAALTGAVSFTLSASAAQRTATP